MTSLIEKRKICESFIVAVLDRIIEARGWDGEMLFLPQRDLRARDGLRDGRVPDEVLDDVVAMVATTIITAAAVAAHDFGKAA